MAPCSAVLFLGLLFGCALCPAVRAQVMPRPPVVVLSAAGVRPADAPPFDPSEDEESLFIGILGTTGAAVAGSYAGYLVGAQLDAASDGAGTRLSSVGAVASILSAGVAAGWAAFILSPTDDRALLTIVGTVAVTSLVGLVALSPDHVETSVLAVPVAVAVSVPLSYVRR